MSQPPPPATPHPSAAPPVSEWQPIFDDASQLYYWWNVKTNAVTWEDPSLAAPPPPPPPTNPPPPTSLPPSAPAVECEESSPLHADERELPNVPITATQDTEDIEPAVSDPKSPPDEPWGAEGAAEDVGPADESLSAKPAGESATSPSLPPDDATADDEDGATEAQRKAEAEYYSSKEYYDWYHSQYSGTVPAVPSAKTGSYGVTTAYGARPGVVGSVDQTDYAVTGSFSTRTGKFQNVDRDPRFAAPEQYFDQHSKASRQMSFFFDYDKFQEERAAERMKEMEGPAAKRAKLTKKDLQFYKQKKQEKKLSSLRTRFGPD
ncbi:hypothetical protein HKX48_008901 [Thoreauomyces humboldtii]|nr:hypothetical protein HKX48_008901 [Thoreauomyces humboldtii]